MFSETQFNDSYSEYQYKADVADHQSLQIETCMLSKDVEDELNLVLESVNNIGNLSIGMWSLSYQMYLIVFI